ncbi:PfkB family carbohydrate kinase [Pseudarthrobacter sp. YS3]|uniref:PfkB family carbohydrate kinase n=1 Tax=Pseudarthrobacter sp. YS3 TaxID=3453718 RepID=UPI003EEB4C7D
MNAPKSDGPPLLVFVGAATTDAIALVEKYPHPDSRTVAEELVHAGGGPAATAAVAAARAGARAAFIGSVGADADGDRIIADLSAEGVDVSAVSRSTGHPSGTSIIVVTRSGSSRAIITRPGPPLDLGGNNARALLSEAAWVHADHMGWPALKTLPDGAGALRLSVDEGNPIPELNLRGVDLYVPSLDRLAARFADSRSSDPDVLLRLAKDAGAAMVVATQGSRGCWGLGPDKAVIHVPASAANIRSTLGAGDVFHGILLTSLAAGTGLQEAMEYAGEAAAKSCEALDGRSGIPRRTPAGMSWTVPTNRTQGQTHAE